MKVLSNVQTPQQQAQNWLAQQGLPNTQLTPLSGYTNFVFLVEASKPPYRSVIRLANHSLAAGLCPLATHPAHSIKLHQQAEQLGLAPALLGLDEQVGIMWLADAGDRQALQTADFPAIRELLERLHDSGLDWSLPDGQAPDIASLNLLTGLSHAPHSPLVHAAKRLLQLATERDYAHLPLVPVHSDLNPGNWLQDGQRWWLIDWDYARLMVAEWDYASLIVEHGWDKDKAQLLAPRIALPDLAWFCAAFALLSWDWHVQRETDQAIKKQAIAAYWLALS
ncbi:phosphotransferase [Thiolinea disciformis]|uniref:phosphotransferase n=1 Tax=Thiolinea disciformis TaxID=125614 RepID=UPI0003804DC6|nr:phosphotransferase [Thiolinea disciformis]